MQSHTRQFEVSFVVTAFREGVTCVVGTSTIDELTLVDDGRLESLYGKSRFPFLGSGFLLWQVGGIFTRFPPKK